MNAKQLATLVLQVLDAQKQYFKTRDRADLIASKQLEAQLRKQAEYLVQNSREPS